LKTAGIDFSNRLLPNDANGRQIAERLYSLVAEKPIISPHGHVDPKMIYENQRFRNPAELFIYFDHYVTRLLHAEGVSLSALRQPSNLGDEEHARNAWKLLCQNWHLFAGTSSGYWLSESLDKVFGISEDLSIENADQTYDLIDRKLSEPEMLPRSLFEKFRIAVLATTDDPVDDLSFHKLLAADESFKGRVIPTFRPDFYIEPKSENWVSRVRQIVDLTNQKFTHDGLLEAIRLRRLYFKEAGAVSIDIGAESPYTTQLTKEQANRIFRRAVAGRASEQEMLDYRGNMIWEMARLSCEDGLVITLHVGVLRNHSSATFAAFGRDTGHDIPVTAEFTKNLRPLLETFGLNSKLQLMLFSLDETTWSREVAPLAGFYPSVFIGAPWWFLDSPESILRFRSAVTETAGFYRGSGFIDDTRAFLSIPARHDMARRVDATYLAGLVTSGKISMQTAEKIALDLVSTIPLRAFKL
jgi:glucuronate isomerase